MYEFVALALTKKHEMSRTATDTYFRLTMHLVAKQSSGLFRKHLGGVFGHW